jgi:hypothetical protein
MHRGRGCGRYTIAEIPQISGSILAQVSESHRLIANDRFGELKAAPGIEAVVVTVTWHAGRCHGPTQRRACVAPPANKVPEDTAHTHSNRKRQGCSTVKV